MKNLSKRYGELTVLDKISVQIKQGEIFVLLGINGAGKTTFLHLISGQICPSSGEVTVLGKKPYHEWQHRNSIGILEEDNQYFSELTVFEFLWWVASLRGLDDKYINIEMDTLTKMFRIDNKVNNLIEELSYGTKRKVCLCAAFIGNPKIIILDEPTNGLDYDSVTSLAVFLNEYSNNGGTAIIACHDIQFVKSINSKVARIENANISYQIAL